MPDGDVAAGIVLFRPDLETLGPLLAALRPQVSRLHLFANGPLAERARILALAPDAVLTEAPVNLGIAAALNALARTARADGRAALVVFDQDSGVRPDHVACLTDAVARARAAGENPAVLGPRPAAGEHHKAPVYRRRPGRADAAGLVPVQFLATSGSLLVLSAWEAVGPFRDDFFIDAVDTEWCFRAWHAGFSCWADPDLPMLHRVGQDAIRVPLLGLAMPRQKPFRMETYLRNSVFGWRLPHIPAGWKWRQALYLPVQVVVYWAASGFRPAILAQLVRGVADGFAGRLGRPRSLP